MGPAWRRRLSPRDHTRDAQPDAAAFGVPHHAWVRPWSGYGLDELYARQGNAGEARGLMVKQTGLAGVGGAWTSRRMESTIQVYFFRTDVSDAAFRAVLSEPELVRAEQFFQRRDRVRMIVCRAMLRHLAGAAAGVAPGEIGIEAGENGKPAFTGPSALAGLYANVSHSGDLGAVALTLVGPVGVDVEAMRSDVEVADLSERYFNNEEQAWLASLQSAERLRGFYRLWVLKEAVLKADGRGLLQPLDSVLVRFAAGVAQVSPWPAVELDAGEGYCAAVSCLTLEMPRVAFSFMSFDPQTYVVD